MRFFIHLRITHEIWGGDLGVIHSLRDGLIEIGHEVVMDEQLGKSLDCDIVFLTNSCQDKQAEAAFLESHGKRYFVLTFHEDFLGYMPSCMGFCEHISGLMKNQINLPVPATLDYLEQNPSIIRYYKPTIKLSGVANGVVLNKAIEVYPSSRFEAKTLLRDAPQCQAKIVLLPTERTDWNVYSNESNFSQMYNIPEGYIIQVGRLEPRKNQIGSVLATRDIERPLVFVASSGGPGWYHNLLANIILRYRKHPTYIIAQSIDSLERGPLTIRRMHDGKKLPSNVLRSAYLGASLNLHPAFHELPGLTYIESISLGIPTVCSSWTGISDYIVGETRDRGVEFVSPESLVEIRDASLRALNSTLPIGAFLPKISLSRFALEIAANVTRAIDSHNDTRIGRGVN